MVINIQLSYLLLLSNVRMAGIDDFVSKVFMLPKFAYNLLQTQATLMKCVQYWNMETFLQHKTNSVKRNGYLWIRYAYEIEWLKMLVVTVKSV